MWLAYVGQNIPLLHGSVYVLIPFCLLASLELLIESFGFHAAHARVQLVCSRRCPFQRMPTSVTLAAEHVGVMAAANDEMNMPLAGLCGLHSIVCLWICIFKTSLLRSDLYEAFGILSLIQK